jgi:serine protease Do
MPKLFSLSTKTLMSSTAAAGLAATMLIGGLPTVLTPAYAEAVRVEAPQAPSFADVVEAVSPAVVSVRVQSEIKPVSDDGSGFDFNFGGKGFGDLPEDHPLKRFFKEFGGKDSEKNQDRADRGSKRGGKDGERRRLRPVSQGSGFFISEDGFVVTNSHVVGEGSAFTVITKDGTEHDAKLIGRDKRTDLAVLKVESEEIFTYVGLADEEKIRVGDWVVAVGNPFGLGGTVTAGIVSARGRDIGAGPYDDFIQVDAAVNRGNSGGPTFNLNGEVIGVNTAIFSPSGGNVGIAFAIPASTVRTVVEDLIENGAVARGWLGVRIQPVSADIAESLGLAEPQGALVSSSDDSTPAFEAGIKAGDVITAVNGETVDDARDLAKKIGAFDPDTDVELTIWRNGKAETMNVKLGTLPVEQALAARTPTDEKPEKMEPAFVEGLGISVEPNSDGPGLVVSEVENGSIAQERGLQPGDVIVAVNNSDVKSAADVAQLMDKASKDGRKAALFQVQRNNQNSFIALPIDQG